MLLFSHSYWLGGNPETKRYWWRWGGRQRFSLTLSIFFPSLFLSSPESLISLFLFHSLTFTHINTKELNFYLLFVSACHFLSIPSLRVFLGFFLRQLVSFTLHGKGGTSLPLLGTTVLVGGALYIKFKWHQQNK